MNNRISRPASTELKARIQAALDSGLTQRQFTALTSLGPVTGQNAGRALMGDRLSDRTIRSLERCCVEFERRQSDSAPREEPTTSPVVTTRARGRIDNVLELAEAMLESSNPKRGDVLYHLYQARRLLEK